MSVPRSALRLLIVLAAVLIPVAVPPSALALDVEPGEVVVQYEPGSAAQAAQASGGAPTVLRVASVNRAIDRLKTRPDVAYAVPNVKAHAAQASTFIPDDAGRGGAGGWQSLQWNFSGPFGVRAPQAWAHAIAAGVPGGTGVVVAVLDTGVAYSNRPPYRRSPDFTSRAFVRGHDFVDRDSYPADRNGHGTHVASTIAEATNNGVGLTGLAYGARIMPVRVLDSAGEGNAVDIAAGIRYAARRGAQVINLSLEFDSDVTAADIPQLLSAISYAKARGAVVVGASGNEGNARVAYPARAGGVLSVGATTENGCLAEFSNGGSGLDLVAPGGGADAPLPGDANCRSGAKLGRNIFQVTVLPPDLTRFGVPANYEGTSMAVPHVSAAAALVIATGVAGEDPTPARVERRLKQTARDLGSTGYDRRYGWGLVNAADATDPGI